MAKKYLVIDAEFHHVPRDAAKEAKGVTGCDIDFKTRIKNPNAAYKRIFNIETALSHMEECGVDMALIGLATWIEPGLKVCRAINDSLAEITRRYPGKFIPLAHIPYLDGRSGIDELERAVNELGLKGVTIMTALRDIRIDDRKLRPFFKKVSRLGVPVMVHPNVKMPVWGGTKYFMSGGVSREYDIIKGFMEAMFGVLPEFPDLKFLFSHYGGGVPFLLGRIMSWYAPGNAGLPKEMIGVPKTIREFEDFGLKKGFNKLLDRVYFNMAGTGGWMTAVKQALMAIKPGKLCFGTDYPFEMSRPSDLKAYINGIKRLDISEKDKAKMLGGNIKRLFRA
ncbi:amidohydrolase family protein [Thermodesulfobacteriota bacterium]